LSKFVLFECEVDVNESLDLIIDNMKGSILIWLR